MSKTYRESQLIYGIIMNLKDHDLDSLSSAFARSKGIPCSTNDDKKDVMTKFSAHIVDLSQM